MCYFVGDEVQQAGETPLGRKIMNWTRPRSSRNFRHKTWVQVSWQFRMSPPPSEHWTQDTFRRKPDSVIDALKFLNFGALCAIASALYPGEFTCEVDPAKYTWGGSNIVFELSFSNGTYWIARVLLPDSAHPLEGKDYVMESEVATLRYLRQNTTIPVPSVYGHDADFNNEVGLPYILMEAMSGKKLFGGGLSDFVPEEHIEKVYRQITDILIQLYEHPFDVIGMLVPDESCKEGYRIDKIFDSCHRLSPYGPFETSLDFYQTRAKLLNDFRVGSAIISVPKEIIPHEDEPEVIPTLVDLNYNFGPFYITHPDFSVFNFLFDDDFNVTGLIDWSGCHTMPIESFANPPDLIVPRPDKFLEGKARAGDLSPERRVKWAERRETFLRTLRKLEVERIKDSPIADMMSSDRAHLAMLLDLEGLQGITAFLPRKEVENLGCTRRVKLEK